MKLTSAVALGSALLAVSIGSALAAQQAPGVESLRVEMAPVLDKLAGDYLGSVRFTMRNPTNKAVRVLKYQTPFHGVEADLFSISVAGEGVDYTGRLVKRGEPAARDYMTLAAGEVRSIDIDLSAYYNFAKSGQYEVRYGNRLHGENGQAKRVNSTPTVMWVDGNDQFLGSRVDQEPWHGYGVKLLNPAPAFTRCTTTQQSQALTALNSARAYSTESRSYYGSHTSASITPRYTTWFGASTPTRYTKATTDYTNIEAALTGQTIGIDCGCKKTYFAYVYPNQPYKIYVCRAFWSAANTGTDSRAGTLIHEVSHFDIVANTDDVVYGQAGAKSLATSDPDGALRNADSHEYFSENTPAQQ